MSDKSDANWLYRKLLADTLVKLCQGNIKLAKIEKLTCTNIRFLRPTFFSLCNLHNGSCYCNTRNIRSSVLHYCIFWFRLSIKWAINSRDASVASYNSKWFNKRYRRSNHKSCRKLFLKKSYYENWSSCCEWRYICHILAELVVKRRRSTEKRSDSS